MNSAKCQLEQKCKERATKRISWPGGRKIDVCLRHHDAAVDYAGSMGLGLEALVIEDIGPEAAK